MLQIGTLLLWVAVFVWSCQVDGAVSVLCDVQNTLVNNVFRV